jgi:hypothetical protein
MEVKWPCLQLKGAIVRALHDHDVWLILIVAEPVDDDCTACGEHRLNLEHAATLSPVRDG